MHYCVSMLPLSCWQWERHVFNYSETTAIFPLVQ